MFIRQATPLLTLLLVLLGHMMALPTASAQDSAFYENEQIVAYEVPEDLDKQQAKPFAEKVATEVSAQVIGHTVTVIAGNIAGLLFSFIQAIPTANPTSSVSFDLMPQSPSTGGEDVNASIIFTLGTNASPLEARFKRKTGLFNWETLEKRTLLKPEEVVKMRGRSLLVLKKPFAIPNKHGQYSIEIGGRSKEFRVTRVIY